ncbi:hypothetical protein VTK26DRAFT_2724 [Humicola hyalothermophila]
MPVTLVYGAERPGSRRRDIPRGWRELVASLYKKAVSQSLRPDGPGVRVWLRCTAERAGQEGNPVETRLTTQKAWPTSEDAFVHTHPWANTSRDCTEYMLLSASSKHTLSCPAGTLSPGSSGHVSPGMTGDGPIHSRTRACRVVSGLDPAARRRYTACYRDKH